ncbi:hypothetical protein SANTM175S_07592 [Streptomyces antimycoticus]
MRILDAILGRSKPVRPDLDRLFGLPGAAVSLEAGAGFTPTGRGSVCFASVEGGAFSSSSGMCGSCWTRTRTGAGCPWSSARTRTATPGCWPGSRRQSTCPPW